MTLNPLPRHAILILDPMPPISTTLAVPDFDSIKYCRRCGRFAEALEKPCPRPQEEWEWDKNTGRRVFFRGLHTTHVIECVTAPTFNEHVRTGIVIAVNNVPDVHVGMRVMIGVAVGKDPYGNDNFFDRRTEEEVRIVDGDAIMAEVE